MPRKSSSDNIVYRTETLEITVEKLDGKVENILITTVPGLREAILSVDTRMKIFTGLNIGALVLALLLQRILGS